MATRPLPLDWWRLLWMAPNRHYAGLCIYIQNLFSDKVLVITHFTTCFPLGRRRPKTQDPKWTITRATSVLRLKSDNFQKHTLVLLLHIYFVLREVMGLGKARFWLRANPSDPISLNSCWNLCSVTFFMSNSMPKIVFHSLKWILTLYEISWIFNKTNKTNF